jgi:uncharacterized GH25 family protein
MATLIVAVACGSGSPEGERVGSASVPAQAGMEMTLTTTPDPVQTGDNTFEVMVREDGKPVTDATVSTEFYMAAMPSMNMPEMRTKTDLTHAGNGMYRGKGQVTMAGDWDVTVRVMRSGQEIGSKKMTLTAK